VTLPKSKLPQLRRKVGVVFQDLKLLVDRTVIENVMLPLELSGVSEVDARKQAEEVLLSVGLAGKFDQFPLQLSGGERQRVAIARALVFDPDVILADEPTGNLDSKTSFQILDLLKSINKQGTTVFMATHNDKILEKTNDRIIVIEAGKLVADKKAKETHEDKKKGSEKEEKEEKEDNKEKEDKKDKIKLASLAKKDD
jgi:cell division transport system ATP-binding protein